MCHDVKTAERFYVALPDKVEGFNTRTLRMEALMKAAEETSSSDEQEAEPILDDEPEESSLSSEDSYMRERRQRLYDRSSVNINYHSSSSDDELHAAQPPVSKRKLNFSVESKSKCVVRLMRLEKNIVDFHSEKGKASVQTPVSLLVPTPRCTSVPPAEPTPECTSVAPEPTPECTSADPEPTSECTSAAPEPTPECT